MNTLLMEQKRIRNCERIETPDGEPVIGKPCHLRLWDGDTYTEIRTSDVVNWWCGYPYAVGEIRVETLNTVYCGQYVQTWMWS